MLLGEVATIQNGFAFKSSQFTKDAGMPLIRIRDVGKDATDTRYVGEYDPAYLVNAGDLLIGMDGDFNSARWHGEPGLLNQRVCRITLTSDIYHPKLLDYALPGYLKAINEMTSSVTVKHLSSKSIAAIPLPLPPMEQQESIVAEIEKQFSRLDEAVANLKRVKANLKRYKAAVLKAAVEGKLTEEWRKAHPAIEPASKLLGRILAERRAKWEEAELAKMEAKGNAPKTDKWKAKYKEPAAPDTTGLPELPKGWVWASYDQVGKLQLGRQRAPKYHSGPNMRPYLRVQNVFEDRIDLSDVMEMDFPPSDFAKYELKPGDLLLNEGQSPELLGRPAIYQGDLPGACFTNTLIRFKAIEGVIVQFALHVSRHYMHSGRFVDEGTITTNIAHLSVGRLATVEFPLPSSAEQARIVGEVDRHLTLIRETETQVDTNLKRAERLRQSILSGAFSGHLYSSLMQAAS